MERYATAKPSKDLSGLYESPVRKSTLFSLFFVRAVRVKKNLVACKSLPPLTPPYKGGGKRAACKYLYPGSKPGACLMPPRPSDPSLCSGQAKEGDRRATWNAGGEQYGNGHSTRRDCLERSDGTFFRSTTERMEKQILSFDRLRTGALLRMTKRESGRGTEGKDPGSSITNVEDDRREKQILPFDRLRTGALLRMTKRENGRSTEGKDPGSSITNVEDDRREKQILSFDRLRTGALLRMTKRENGRCTEGPHEMRRVRMQEK